MKINSFLILIALILALLGVSLRFSDSLFFIQSSDTAYAHRALSSYQPKMVIIESVSIKIDIIPGGIIDGKWILSPDSAHALPISSSYNDHSAILYAHNREGLFMNLSEVTIGDTITIIDERGKKILYSVFEKQTITPEQTDVIQPDSDGTLVLFTCDGWFDEKRIVVKAKVISSY